MNSSTYIKDVGDDKDAIGNSCTKDGNALGGNCRILNVDPFTPSVDPFALSGDPFAIGAINECMSGYDPFKSA
jgi:hypothetical protein